MSSQTFPFRFDPRFRAPLAVLGVRPDTCRVVVDDDGFDARFGRWRLRTPWSNVKDVQITRDYRWFRAVGPRASLADHGATFGTNTVAGVCVCFHEPVGALVSRTVFRHPGLTVTVEDVEGLAAAVRERLPS